MISSFSVNTLRSSQFYKDLGGRNLIGDTDPGVIDDGVKGIYSRDGHVKDVDSEHNSRSLDLVKEKEKVPYVHR